MIMTNDRNDPSPLMDNPLQGCRRLARNPLLASLALLALVQLGGTAIASPPMLMTTTLCGSGRILPLPVKRQEDKDGKHDPSCPMPCHGMDRRRRAFAA